MGKRRKSLAEIAEIAGVSVRTVSRAVSEDREVWLAERRKRGAEMQAMRDRGALWREVAEEFGTSVNAAQMSAKRHRDRVAAERAAAAAEAAREEAEGASLPLSAAS